VTRIHAGCQPFGFGKSPRGECAFTVAQLFNEAAKKLRAEFEFIRSWNGVMCRHRGER
jgi:hypothetical protein